MCIVLIEIYTKRCFPSSAYSIPVRPTLSCFFRILLQNKVLWILHLGLLQSLWSTAVKQTDIYHTTSRKLLIKAQSIDCPFDISVDLKYSLWRRICEVGWEKSRKGISNVHFYTKCAARSKWSRKTTFFLLGITQSRYAAVFIQISHI